jgi:hypothetical protein
MPIHAKTAKQSYEDVIRERGVAMRQGPEQFGKKLNQSDGLIL